MNTMIEMYDRIMSVVEEVTGISKDKILTSITPKVMGKYIKPRTIQQVPPKVINCPNCGK